MGRYIYANLFRVFDIRKEHLCETGQSLFRAIHQDKFRRFLPESLAHSNALLIFPSHPVTDHVIDCFLALVDDEAKRSDIYSRCIPILPLRRHRGGSGLQISGLTLERLEILYHSKQPETPPVVFFDDAMISGRTYSEIKSLLHNIGFRNIYSLVMLDRQRLPSAYHVNRSTDRDDGTKNACYWRLDAPALGSQGHCPLCRGLGRAIDLSQRLYIRENRVRVHSWQENWSERNPATEWGDGGLRPIPFDLEKAERKFGIVPDEPDKKYSARYRQAGGRDQMIRLTNSVGLAAWITELYSITSRDDLPLRLLQTEDLSPEVKIQILSTQLLLFFGEFDTELATDLGYELARALYDAKKDDRNTALAALTLVAYGDRVLERVIPRLTRELESHENDNTPIASLLKEINLDFWVLLEICFVLGINIGRFKPRRYSDSVELGGKDSKTPPENRLDLYHRLYREILAGQSESYSPYLSRLANLPEESNSNNQAYFDRAKESAVRLHGITQRLDPFWLRNDSGYKKEYKDDFWVRSEEIGELAETLKKEIAEAERAYKDDPTQSIDLRKCKETAKTLLNSGLQVFRGAFIPLGIQKSTTMD